MTDNHSPISALKFPDYPPPTDPEYFKKLVEASISEFVETIKELLTPVDDSYFQISFNLFNEPTRLFADLLLIYNIYQKSLSGNNGDVINLHACMFSLLMKAGGKCLGWDESLVKIKGDGYCAISAATALHFMTNNPLKDIDVVNQPGKEKAVRFISNIIRMGKKVLNCTENIADRKRLVQNMSIHERVLEILQKRVPQKHLPRELYCGEELFLLNYNSWPAPLLYCQQVATHSWDPKSSVVSDKDYLLAFVYKFGFLFSTMDNDNKTWHDIQSDCTIPLERVSLQVLKELVSCPLCVFNPNGDHYDILDKTIEVPVIGASRSEKKVVTLVDIHETSFTELVCKLNARFKQFKAQQIVGAALSRLFASIFYSSEVTRARSIYNPTYHALVEEQSKLYSEFRYYNSNSSTSIIAEAALQSTSLLLVASSVTSDLGSAYTINDFQESFALFINISSKLINEEITLDERKQAHIERFFANTNLLTELFAQKNFTFGAFLNGVGEWMVSLNGKHENIQVREALRIPEQPLEGMANDSKLVNTILHYGNLSKIKRLPSISQYYLMKVRQGIRRMALDMVQFLINKAYATNHHETTTELLQCDQLKVSLAKYPHLLLALQQLTVSIYGDEYLNNHGNNRHFYEQKATSKLTKDFSLGLGEDYFNKLLTMAILYHGEQTKRISKLSSNKMGNLVASSAGDQEDETSSSSDNDETNDDNSSTKKVTCVALLPTKTSPSKEEERKRKRKRSHSKSTKTLPSQAPLSKISQSKKVKVHYHQETKEKTIADGIKNEIIDLSTEIIDLINNEEEMEEIYTDDFIAGLNAIRKNLSSLLQQVLVGKKKLMGEVIKKQQSRTKSSETSSEARTPLILLPSYMPVQRTGTIPDLNGTTIPELRRSERIMEQTNDSSSDDENIMVIDSTMQNFLECAITEEMRMIAMAKGYLILPNVSGLLKPDRFIKLNDELKEMLGSTGSVVGYVPIREFLSENDPAPFNVGGSKEDLCRRQYHLDSNHSLYCKDVHDQVKDLLDCAEFVLSRLFPKHKLFDPALLFSPGGGTQQGYHVDYASEQEKGAELDFFHHQMSYSYLFAVEDGTKVHMVSAKEDELEYFEVVLKTGEILLFKASQYHAGAAYESPSIRLHGYLEPKFCPVFVKTEDLLYLK